MKPAVSMPAAGETCTPTVARYVRFTPPLYRSDGRMHISQLMVYDTTGKNVAKRRPVSYSEMWDKNSPHFAVDGVYSNRTWNSIFSSSWQRQITFWEE
jgi:hypothetical protein